MEREEMDIRGAGGMEGMRVSRTGGGNGRRRGRSWLH